MWGTTRGGLPSCGSYQAPFSVGRWRHGPGYGHVSCSAHLRSVWRAPYACKLARRIHGAMLHEPVQPRRAVSLLSGTGSGLLAARTLATRVRQPRPRDGSRAADARPWLMRRDHHARRRRHPRRGRGVIGHYCVGSDPESPSAGSVHVLTPSLPLVTTPTLHG